jgi:hypothetical protein
MTPGGFSIRGLMLAVGVVGFDAAVMARAFRLGRMVHDVATYTIGFGSVFSDTTRSGLIGPSSHG